MGQEQAQQQRHEYTAVHSSKRLNYLIGGFILADFTHLNPNQQDGCPNQMCCEPKGDTISWAALLVTFTFHNRIHPTSAGVQATRRRFHSNKLTDLDSIF